MMIQRCLVAGAIALLIQSCSASLDATVAPEDMDRVYVCTDTRDGEVFSYNTNTITNARITILGGGPSSMDIVTTDGRKMTVTSAMTAWWKCKELEKSHE